jgi:hypothetical protein
MDMFNITGTTITPAHEAEQYVVRDIFGRRALVCNTIIDIIGLVIFIVLS